jgi:hypothetical protein
VRVYRKSYKQHSEMREYKKEQISGSISYSLREKLYQDSIFIQTDRVEMGGPKSVRKFLNNL